jgi:HEAT repeat protein
MQFVFSWTRELGPAALVLKAIFGSLLGIALLVAFIIFRRWYRGVYFRHRNERTLALRTVWDDIVSGRIPPQTWRPKKLDSEVVETILLDCIETAKPEELPKLLGCLRASGLLDLRIYEARSARGLRRRGALVALGRTRAPEAIPALAEALQASTAENRIAAVRGLGRTGLSEAARPLLDALLDGELHVPEHTVKNALVNCCREHPWILIDRLPQAKGQTRELLARVLAEVATSEFGDELLVLATDRLPEVRASAARALGNAKPAFALSLLAGLAQDSEWFVRLRAVVALGSMQHPGRVRTLLRALCDPNRYVRQRSAWALAQMQPDFEDILEQVVATGDRYALEAFTSELERSGGFEKVALAIEQRSDARSAAAVLGDALALGRQRAARKFTTPRELEGVVH